MIGRHGRRRLIQINCARGTPVAPDIATAFALDQGFGHAKA